MHLKELVYSSLDDLMVIAKEQYSTKVFIDALFHGFNPRSHSNGYAILDLNEHEFINKTNIICDAILQYEADLTSLEIYDFRGKLPLEVIHKLIKHGLNPQIILNGALSGFEDVIFLGSGNDQAKSLEVLFSDLIETQHTMVELSIEAGADVNKVKKVNAVYLPKTANYLVDKGMDPNKLWKSGLLPIKTRDGDGKNKYNWHEQNLTQLKQELVKNALEIQQIILEKGADPKFIIAALSNIKYAEAIEVNDLQAKLFQFKLNYNAEFNNVIDLKDHIDLLALEDGYTYENVKVLSATLGEKTTFFHIFTALGALEILNFLKVNYDLKVNSELRNDNGQTPLFFVPDIEFYDFLITLGVNPNLTDNQGRYWLEYANEDVVLQLIGEGLISETLSFRFAEKLYIKGDFYMADQIFKCLSLFHSPPQLDYVNIVTLAIIQGIQESIDSYKYQALIQLFAKHKLDLPAGLLMLKNVLNKKLDNMAEQLLSQEVLKPLAKHFVKLAESKLINDLFDESNNCNLKLAQTIKDIYKANGEGAYHKFQHLKSEFPFSKILTSIESQFDAIHKTLGLALILIDEDYSLEILALSALPPASHEENIMVYHGAKAYNIEVDDNYIDFIFKHGYKIGSSSHQYLFRYYVTKWKEIEITSTPSYDFGGVYVSTSPDKAYPYATKFVLEMKQSKGHAKICGDNTGVQELIPNYLNSKDIKALYLLNNEYPYRVLKIYLNPYYLTSANESKLAFEIGDTAKSVQDKYSPSTYNFFDLYNRIGCAEELKPEKNIIALKTLLQGSIHKCLRNQEKRCITSW